MSAIDIGYVLLGVACSLAAVALGVFGLRRMRARALIASLLLLTLTPLVAVIAGIVVASGFMFTAELGHSAVIWVAVAVVCVPSAVWLGRTLAHEIVWEREARERERQAELSRRRMLAWLSHDLRTPVSGVLAMAEALEDGVVERPDDVKEYAGLIRSETNRLAGMIDDLFELARIDAGDLRLELEPVPVAEVLHSAVQASRASADRRGVRLEVDVPTDVTHALGEGPALVRVVRNLLGNAIRHTPGRRRRHGRGRPGRRRGLAQRRGRLWRHPRQRPPVPVRPGVPRHVGARGRTGKRPDRGRHGPHHRPRPRRRAARVDRRDQPRRRLPLRGPPPCCQRVLSGSVASRGQPVLGLGVCAEPQSVDGGVR